MTFLANVSPQVVEEKVRLVAAGVPADVRLVLRLPRAARLAAARVVRPARQLEVGDAGRRQEAIRRRHDGHRSGVQLQRETEGADGRQHGGVYSRRAPRSCHH